MKRKFYCLLLSLLRATRKNTTVHPRNGQGSLKIWIKLFDVCRLYKNSLTYLNFQTTSVATEKQSKQLLQVETILTLVCVLCPCLAFIIDCIAPASLLEGPLRFVPMLYVLFQSFMDTVNSRFSEDSLTLRQLEISKQPRSKTLI